MRSIDNEKIERDRFEMTRIDGMREKLLSDLMCFNIAWPKRPSQPRKVQLP